MTTSMNIILISTHNYMAQAPGQQPSLGPQPNPLDNLVQVLAAQGNVIVQMLQQMSADLQQMSADLQQMSADLQQMSTGLRQLPASLQHIRAEQAQVQTRYTADKARPQRDVAHAQPPLPNTHNELAANMAGNSSVVACQTAFAHLRLSGPQADERRSQVSGYLAGAPLG